jgi:hypothetical protein
MPFCFKRLPILFIFFLQPAYAAIISMNAGSVGEHIVTTREVLIRHLVDDVMTAHQKTIELQLDHPKSRDFVRETTTTLLENAIFIEAESIAAATVSKEKIQAAIVLVQNKMRKNSQWASLEVGSEELRKIVTHILRSKEFIKFKVDSASIPISDREAEEYFNANRLKFENLPFANFKSNIKAYLTKQQVDRRLKEWFELLQSKYHIRNQLAD